jgi:hypothetical protein
MNGAGAMEEFEKNDRGKNDFYSDPTAGPSAK